MRGFALLMFVYHLHIVPMKARTEYQILKNWSYRQQ